VPVVTAIGPLYAIVDASFFADSAEMLVHAKELAAAGVNIIQYRNKSGDARQMLSDARDLRKVLGRGVRLIMNDRADLCLGAMCDGVHIGQDDLSPTAARIVVGDSLLVGLSTHSLDQVLAADASPVDYIAIGPVFATSSKPHHDPVIGLEGVRAARRATSKPLVAIGGITRSNARSVLQAGADAVAVISDLIKDPRGAAQDFLRLVV
jgi:thiamine-phosphate pyrophosphorylase